MVVSSIQCNITKGSGIGKGWNLKNQTSKKHCSNKLEKTQISNLKSSQGLGRILLEILEDRPIEQVGN